MVDTWTRTVHSGLVWPVGNQLIVAIPQADTLLRVHWGWGFYGNTSTDTSLLDVAQNLMVMGLVTTVGNGSETPPNARTQAGNQAPPTQRWIFWEARAPKIAAYDSVGGVALWQDSGDQEPVQSKGMVSAATVPSGDTLNLWASWAASTAWDASGSVNLWFYASVARAATVG
jgi:hypothetical protein